MFLDSNSGKILLWNNFFVMFFHVRNFLSSIESVWYDYEQAGYTNCYSGCTYLRSVEMLLFYHILQYLDLGPGVLKMFVDYIVKQK